ncbi:hypothetical protein KQ304_12515 [Synechococcus sp. CS-1329]|uniref:glycosyltransferase family 10 domain-containing protein n=1 Tax=Synechococcus sp. CS-1329 TaxID=2847975 RepID=UPI00223AD23A|nr:glycosyltransferase family 10 [Synechococcus sp. CS-1329]MCT0219803.1 hypothetical protein [Synechococcus sp. CS-1329]
MSPADTLFSLNTTLRCSYYSIPHCSLKNLLLHLGIRLRPFEAFSASYRADALISVDLPHRRYELEHLIAQKVKPDAPKILIAMESFHDRPELLSSDEISRWHHVFHYSTIVRNGSKVSKYALPSNLPYLYRHGPFYGHASLRLIGMMGTNKPSRLSNIRAWPQVINTRSYRISLSDSIKWWGLEDGLNLRRQWATGLAHLIPKDFRIFGGQWDGSSYSPAHRLIRPRPNPCAVGFSPCNPISIIQGFQYFFATENLIGDSGYVTEKIFNVIRARRVPIYKPANDDKRLASLSARVGRFFVDLREFNSAKALVAYLKSVKIGEYQEMVASGHLFLKSEFAKEHSSRHYAEVLSKRISLVLRQKTV